MHWAMISFVLTMLAGVQKEFFQLVIEAILSPSSALFVELPDTHNFWLNGTIIWPA